MPYDLEEPKGARWVAHDQKSQDSSPEKALERVGSVLDGLESFVEAAERITRLLHYIAKNVRTMEEDGSLSQLMELLQRAQQTQGSLFSGLQDEMGVQKEEDDP
jgi:hypothetical protein